ncbi:LysR substrate-binding domain-containing protein [Duganella aceris]|uniref:LysR family transcriptional regulator n=1 Tax=Duganella aceris TaxID=2703883 RepID=A0ABX0FRC3_9BURK|nr:LysR substrate-binding domain-containing protein [Duganella aceris]NGZ87059.1 LysR family transcriptional regulator [Duganella aceris]
MSLSGINLRDFEYVIAVAELGSFVKAAERCHVSQPSLSIQINKLEDRLKVVIFERTTRRNIITPQGRELIEQMRKVLREADQLLAMTGDSGLPFGGTLRLSAIATLGPYYFPHVLQGLRRAYPDLALVLSEGKTDELIVALSNGEVDAILISPPFADAGLQSAPLFREPFVMASPSGHHANADQGCGWQGLAPNDRLLLSEGHCLRDQAIAACSDVSASNRHATSLETLKYMVAAGEGCTLMPALAASEVAGLVYTPLTGTAYARTIALAWRRSDPRGAELAQLASHLRAFRHPAIENLG